MKTFSKYVPAVLLVVYIAVFIWGAINPHDWPTWRVENGPIALIALVLAVLYFRGVRFSPLSYVLMSVLLIWHTIGGHYTFERVPFGWFNDFFGFERNMYDRVGHFTVGFYAYPIMEYLVTRNKMSKTSAFFFAIFTIAFVAMSYELIEWYYAVSTSDAQAGSNFLGSQGDIWDAQKDMLMDTLGAVSASILYLVTGMKNRNTLPSGASKEI